MADFKNYDVKSENVKNEKAEVRANEVKEQPKVEKTVESTVAQAKENVNPKIENKPAPSKVTKRMGKLSAKVGRNVIIIDKDGKGVCVPNTNYKNAKVGQMVEY